MVLAWSERGGPWPNGGGFIPPVAHYGRFLAMMEELVDGKREGVH
jgi:hypothetical protein